VIVLSKIPKAPKNFSAEARGLWKKVCGELIARRTLTTTAVFTVEQFCLLTVAARTAATDRKAGYAQRLALVREARLLGESLGLSPSAQQKVKPPAGALTDSADDRLWAEIVGGETEEPGRKRRGSMRPRSDS
jgi:phage terminase small subunit